MNKILAIVTIFISTSAYANSYICMGLDDQEITKVDLQDAPKTIGTVNGMTVGLADKDGSVTLTVVRIPKDPNQQVDWSLSTSGKSGSISLIQADLTSSWSIQCVQKN